MTDVTYIVNVIEQRDVSCLQMYCDPADGRWVTGIETRHRKE